MPRPVGTPHQKYNQNVTYQETNPSGNSTGKTTSTSFDTGKHHKQNDSGGSFNENQNQGYRNNSDKGGNSGK